MGQERSKNVQTDVIHIWMGPLTNTDVKATLKVKPKTGTVVTERIVTNGLVHIFFLNNFKIILSYHQSC